MKAVVWVVEGTWRACVDAARDLVPACGELTLLYVVDDEVAELSTGTLGGLLGRGRRRRHEPAAATDPATSVGQALLDKAARRLGRDSTQTLRHGRVEREVVAETDDADLLVVARDGDRAHLGPRSLGHASRFVVDHAPCAVILVWPEATPDLATLPPPPPAGHHPGPPPHPPHPPHEPPHE